MFFVSLKRAHCKISCEFFFSAVTSKLLILQLFVMYLMDAYFNVINCFTKQKRHVNMGIPHYLKTSGFAIDYTGLGAGLEYICLLQNY